MEYSAKVFFAELCEYTHNQNDCVVIAEFVDIGGEKNMKNQSNVINNWTDTYLNTIETLYGAFNLHPALTMQELSDEWTECFRPDGQVRVDLERSELVEKWSRSYLAALETLYGEFNLHPTFAIQVLCQEWQPQLMSNSKKQRLAS